MMSLTEPLPFITLTDDDCFEVSHEASEYLRSVEGEVSIVAIAGLYRTGKSYLLNQLLGRTTEHTMFGVGGTVNAMTKGIWIWGQPVDDGTKSNKTIIFMDTEGLGSAQRSQTQDTRIFALALLLSSFFIYNSRGVIDANAIEDLSLVVNLTKYIQVTAGGGGATNLADFFPAFLWVVRDFTLQLEEEGRAITSRDYLEKALKPQPGSSDDTQHKNEVRHLLSTFFPARDCITMVRPLNDESRLRDLPAQPFESLRPEFRDQLAALKTRVFSSLQPKKLMSKPLNGAMLVTLAQNYVDAFNSGASPVISSAWDRVVQAQSEELLDAAKDAFTAAFARPTTHPVKEDALRAQFDTACANAVAVLRESAVAADTVPINQPLLDDWTVTQLRAAWDHNDALAKKMLLALLQESYAPIAAQGWQPLAKDATSADVVAALHTKLASFDTLLKQFVMVYLDKTAGYPLQTSTLCTFLAEKVMDGVVNWGTLVTVLFRQQDSAMQKGIASARQKVKALEGKAAAAAEMLAQQKDTYERALAGITDRLQEEKLTLRAEMDHKDGEMKRTAMQIERIATLHTEALDRLSDDLKQAKDELRAAEARVDAARLAQDSVVQDTAKQRLDNERTKHAKEQELLEAHHKLLEKVVGLERQLGEQDAEHMTAVFKMDSACQEKVAAAQTECDDHASELKTHTIGDIRILKTQQEGQLRALQVDLNDRQAVLSALQERLEMKRRQTMAASSGGAKKGGKEDCVVM
ncbi:Aste57867_9503 [Aphanomyces stellatus]|uniref:Aste57867_9503 protein n=1 Tax=Aphanomyces stellatus TaxID=120398 RepID=A0A485KN59_9STRA|nr:hypothetical protein As57867_009466 [Aphanomyces stellatus]VFT86382.1 Aste57867_9503 [Aphanomyces stellatus]